MSVIFDGPPLNWEPIRFLQRKGYTIVDDADYILAATSYAGDLFRMTEEERMVEAMKNHYVINFIYPHLRTPEMVAYLDLMENL